MTETKKTWATLRKEAQALTAMRIALRNLDSIEETRMEADRILVEEV